jgi:DEAD/DEAH box helicase domain-containing protein
MAAWDAREYLDGIRSHPAYRGQIVHSHTLEPRDAVCADTAQPLSEAARAYMQSIGIERLYSHQAEAVDTIRNGKDVLIATGTASGKSLCYQLPLLEMLESDPDGRAILLYPTKALAQNQFRALNSASLNSQLSTLNLMGVFDGDTPSEVRRKLRDEGRIVLTNPDMVHASLMPQHPRWAEFIANLKYVVIDELHTYSGLFGSNAANLFRRLQRICRHYGSDPVYIFCTATIGNPVEVAEKLTGRTPVLIDNDGSPRGRKTYVFWNPPKQLVRRKFKTRRSANVEAHELMTDLVRAGVPTITFSKAKVTAELIHRYVTESLQKLAPHLADKVTPYRGGYLPEERREIERRLFSGELLGVSTTRALELGIDVGGLDAAIVVGYPGTLAGFFQQTGRAGRRERDSIAFLVAVDTAVNQYVMNNPAYVFGRPVERVVLDPDNAYVLAGQLRCAAFEMPIDESEVDSFGPHARLVLDVLVEQGKLAKIRAKWYHASDDIPHNDHGLRWCDRFNITIIDVDTNLVIGELSKYDAQPIIHPEAIYMHQGETYLVLDLDMDRNQCLVKKVETEYYTQPSGGEDVHHIDHPLREKKFGDSTAYFGEVSVYFNIGIYEKINFYSLETLSWHELKLPHYQLETMAFWITPSEELARDVMGEGLDVHRGLMGIGYATRMILPLFISCETLDFSHSSCTAVNAPWHTMFVYERYPLGLGFTEKAYEILDEVLLAVRDRIRQCDCIDGCPCCVGKPLRGYTTWNIELGEANIPSKKAALRILDGIIGDGSGLKAHDDDSLGQDEAERKLVLERGIRRRLERLADPEHIFHPVDPTPETGVPEPIKPGPRQNSDVARRAMKRMSLAKQSNPKVTEPAAEEDLKHEEKPKQVIELGDSVAARARKMRKRT